MKLYYSKQACSLAVRILIHELGISCEYEAVNLPAKKTASGGDFYQINPKGSVPVLVLDDGKILTENAVIHQYLAEKHHATTLFPPNTQFEHYRILEWLNFISTDLHKGISPLFSPLPEEMKEKFIRPIFLKKLSLVENHLQNNQFLMGSQFTLPDGYLFVIISWLRGLHIPLENFPNMQRYFNEIKTRKSVQQALAEEKISI